MMTFFAELRRRNVLRVAGLYLVGAWLATQVAGTLLPMFGAPEWIARTIVLLLAIGLLPVLLFSWVFELTPEGLKKESEIDRSQSIAPHTGVRLQRMTLALGVLALGYFVVDKFALAPRRQAAEVSAAVAKSQADAQAMASDASIAVLPFVNMSSDKEQEYFSDGISEELLNQLARIPDLRVIARTSSFSYKGKQVKVEQIGKELNVGHVLEGSIRKSGEKVRITAQLIRTADSSHRWSQTYDRPMADIFAVQDEVSAAVVAQLKLKLLGAAPTAAVVDPRAYELRLQARALARRGNVVGHDRALELLQQALAIAPADPAAWAQLSGVYSSQADTGGRPVAEGYRLARDAANRALAHDPAFAAAHAALGRIALNHDSDLATAARHYSRALALAPADVDTLNGAATLSRSLGRLPAAIALFEQQVVRDPGNPGLLSNLGFAYYAAGRWDEAIARQRQALELSPARLASHYDIAMALLQKGEPQAAMADLRLEPRESGWALIGLPMAWHALGDPAQADAALAELIRQHERDSAYNIAYVHAFRGDADKAFAWLDKAVTYRDPGLSDIVAQPEFASIHQDPRWLPFLRKLGMAPEQLDAIAFDPAL